MVAFRCDFGIVARSRCNVLLDTDFACVGGLQTIRTKVSTGSRAALEAAGTTGRIALGAATHAAVAARIAAHCTDANAVFAVIIAAAFAITALVRRHAMAAIRAVDAVPVLKRNERTVCVVMRQHAADQDEGVCQTTLRQCFFDRDFGIARAETLIAHVRMRDIRIGRCRIRCQRDDIETRRTGPALRSRPVKLDFERTEFDVFQGDGIGRDRNDLAIPIDAHFAKFVF